MSRPITQNIYSICTVRIESLTKAFLYLCAGIGLVSQAYGLNTYGYTPGYISGCSDRTPGFSDGWIVADGTAENARVLSDSMAYPGADTAFQEDSGSLILLDGVRVGRFLDTTPEGVFAEYLNSQGTIGQPGQTLYISFMMKSSQAPLFFAFELKRGDLGDGGAVLYIGNDLGSPANTIQVCAFRDRNQDPSNIGVHLNFLGDAATDTDLHVIRIDFGTTGDNVTVYRNPSLDAEPVKSPDLINAGFLHFDAFSMAAFIGPTVQFDEICFATSYADAVRFYDLPGRAQNPTPPDGAAGIVTSTVDWQAGTGVHPNGYEVYFSDDIYHVISENAAAYQGGTADTHFEIGALQTDSTYYWSVNEMVEGGGKIPGSIWTFKTLTTIPTIQVQPTSREVLPGQTVSFEVQADSMSRLFYQWYDNSGPMTDGDNISGSHTQNLIIANAQMSDQNTYYCVISSAGGTITSAAAELRIKRLVGHWTLNKPLDVVPSMFWRDASSSDNHLQPAYTIPDDFVWVQGADGTPDGALVFDGQFALKTLKPDGTMNDIPVGDDPYTIFTWIKPAKADGVGIIGWGNYGTANQVNAVKLHNTTTVWHYWWGIDLGGSCESSLVDNDWHLVAVTYDGDLRKVYIDGQMAGQDTPPAHAVPTSENFLIGKTNTLDLTSEFFDGAMDEVKVYNYALSPVEVAQAYTGIMGGQMCIVPPRYDMTGDCRVNLDDLAEMVSAWLECGLVPSCLD